jgi:hypothetical protein
VHIRGVQFYRWEVLVWVHVGDPVFAEARRLLDLRYRLSADTASVYCAAGFTTVVQDNIYGSDVEHWLQRVQAPAKHLVVLRPSVGVVEARDAQRTRDTGKVASRDGYTPVINDEHVATTRADRGLWLDTSELSAQQTVEEILRRANEARIT